MWMSFWRKLLAVIKLLLAAAITVFCIMLLVNNAGQQTTVWYWPGKQETTSIVYLALFSFVAGGLVVFLAGASIWTYLSMRWKRARKMQATQDRHTSELHRKAGMLRQRTPAAVRPVETHSQDESPIAHERTIDRTSDRTIDPVIDRMVVDETSGPRV